LGAITTIRAEITSRRWRAEGAIQRIDWPQGSSRADIGARALKP
jgi:hypothetical protein